LWIVFCYCVIRLIKYIQKNLRLVIQDVMRTFTRIKHIIKIHWSNFSCSNRCIIFYYLTHFHCDLLDREVLLFRWHDWILDWIIFFSFGLDIVQQNKNICTRYLLVFTQLFMLVSHDETKVHHHFSIMLWIYNIRNRNLRAPLQLRLPLTRILLIICFLFHN